MVKYPISELTEFDAYLVSDEYGTEVVAVREVTDHEGRYSGVYKVIHIEADDDEDGVDGIDPHFFTEDAIWYVDSKTALDKLLKDLNVKKDSKPTKIKLFDVVRVYDG